MSPEDRQKGYATRSRGGCRSCKRLRKKCDEQRPSCALCQRARRHCEYGLPLTWKTPLGGPKSSLHDELSINATSWPDQADLDHEPSPSSSVPIQLDKVEGCGANEPLPAGNEHVPTVVKNEIEASLLNEFRASGHKILGSRVLSESPIFETVVPLTRSSHSIARACLAIQAYVNISYRHLFAGFLDEAVNLFRKDLLNPSRLNDRSLMTGTLLCSVSITAILLWTAHLKGLESIIVHLGYDSVAVPRDNYTQFLVEGIGLLDLPGATIGRRDPDRRIWTRFVSPHKKRGIEPTTGLPRDLIDIMASLGSPDTFTKLSAWMPSDKAEHVLQYQYWETFRMTLLLTARSSKNDEHASSIYFSAAATESMIARILASYASLKGAENPFRTPLHLCMLWPLFTAAIHTESDTIVRSLAAATFQDFVKSRNHHIDHVVWALILEVWTRKDRKPELDPLDIAHDFAREVEVELHLY